jgi:hypothetical protein
MSLLTLLTLRNLVSCFASIADDDRSFARFFCEQFAALFAPQFLRFYWWHLP